MADIHYLFIFDDINSTVEVHVDPEEESIKMVRCRSMESALYYAGLDEVLIINKVHLTMWDITLCSRRKVLRKASQTITLSPCSTGCT